MKLNGSLPVFDGKIERFPVSGQTIPRFLLDLSFMKLGDNPNSRSSWFTRMVVLRKALRPFRIAWLETPLRVVDMRASEKAQ